MDEVDIAQRNQEQLEQLHLQWQLNRPQGTSATECEVCGELIPEARRMAAVGCSRCVACQLEFEKRT